MPSTKVASSLTKVDDADYNYVRSMYKTIGVDSFSKFVGD